MCAIAGFISIVDKSWNEKIRKMCDTMVTRGPDGYGIWHDDKNKLTLGHRRLAILDLTENGSQPMVSASERYVITFNGEIYNHNEIKDIITKKRVLKLKGTSDTEVLLEAIDCLGIDEAISLARGMFSLAVVDRDNGILYLVRDRMGEKPLYYGCINGDFIFASNLDAVISYTGKIDLNRRALLEYLCYGYIPGTLTVYDGIYKVLPGEKIAINIQNRNIISKEKYWDIMDISTSGKVNKSEEELTEIFEDLLKKSVKEQMVADVPVGAYLSGGVDSSLIVAMMQQQIGNKVKTFTIGIEGSDTDEASWAQKVANVLGVEHTVQYITKDNMVDSILVMGKTFDEPFADVSQVPTYMVSKLAKEKVTVTLSGDGGDELFCGYNHYSQYNNIWKDLKNNKKYNPITHFMASCALRMPRNRFSDRCMDFKTKCESKSLEGLYRAIAESLSYGNIIVRDAVLDGLRQDDVPLQKYTNPGLDELDNLMLVDQIQYLPDDILVKVDRTGMAVSLENRIPLLDKRIIEFAWSIPSVMKYDGITTKKIMRNVLYKYVPKNIIERPKQGFSFPALSWIIENNELKECINRLFYSRISETGIFNKQVIIRLWNEYLNRGFGSHIIWNLIMLLIWADERDIYL